MLDMGITALVDDLTASGRIDDVSIVVWGEFGRSPRINGDAGRDHWPRVGGALMAGGGIRSGQVLGATNAMGESAIELESPHKARQICAGPAALPSCVVKCVCRGISVLCVVL